MDPLLLLLYVVIGLIAGFFGGLLGVTGGLITVPSLLLAFSIMGFLPSSVMHMAIGTSLAATVFTAASSAYTHYLNKKVNWTAFTYMSPGIVLGTLIGSIVADKLPSIELELIFGCCTALIGLYFLLSNNSDELEKAQPSVKAYYFFITGIGIATLSAILGIGGGIMTVPILTAFRLSLRSAISTSALVGLLIAVIGSFSFLYLGLSHPQPIVDSIGYIYLPAFIVMGLVAVFAANFGARIAYKWSEKTLRKILGSILFSVGLFMTYSSLFNF